MAWELLHYLWMDWAVVVAVVVVAVDFNNGSDGTARGFVVRFRILMFHSNAIAYKYLGKVNVRSCSQLFFPYFRQWNIHESNAHTTHTYTERRNGSKRKISDGIFSHIELVRSSLWMLTHCCNMYYYYAIACRIIYHKIIIFAPPNIRYVGWAMVPCPCCAVLCTYVIYPMRVNKYECISSIFVYYNIDQPVHTQRLCVLALCAVWRRNE